MEGLIRAVELRDEAAWGGVRRSDEAAAAPAVRLTAPPRGGTRGGDDWPEGMAVSPVRGAVLWPRLAVVADEAPARRAREAPTDTPSDEGGCDEVGAADRSAVGTSGLDDPCRGGEPWSEWLRLRRAAGDVCCKCRFLFWRPNSASAMLSRREPAWGCGSICSFSSATEPRRERTCGAGMAPGDCH